jgi:hypothetical protein
MGYIWYINIYIYLIIYHDCVFSRMVKAWNKWKNVIIGFIHWPNSIGSLDLKSSMDWSSKNVDFSKTCDVTKTNAVSLHKIGELREINNSFAKQNTERSERASDGLEWQRLGDISQRKSHKTCRWLFYPLVICYIAIGNDPFYSWFTH